MNMNLNLSGFFNVFRLAAKPSLCLPHATVSTFNDIPVPLEKAFEDAGKKANIKAVVLDKDDCFAYPDTNEIYGPYKERFRKLREEFPGRRLLIVSNTAGATSYDRGEKMAATLEDATGVTVLSHKTKKPGCGDEIMAYFRKNPETGVTDPSQVVVIGDRLTTDMLMANMMGSWGLWVKDGVAPANQKSAFAKIDHTLGSFLLRRGFHPPQPRSPFE